MAGCLHRVDFAYELCKTGFAMEKIINDTIQEIIEFISEAEKLRGREAVKVYTMGNCGNFHDLLKQLIPSAVPYEILRQKTNYSHIVTNVGKQYYDITGMVNMDEYFNNVEEYQVRVLADAENKACRFAFGGDNRLDSFYIRDLLSKDQKDEILAANEARKEQEKIYMTENADALEKFIDFKNLRETLKTISNENEKQN